MKTKIELEQDIIDMTVHITRKFPELSKYIQEMPVFIVEDDDEIINNRNLKEYYDSLVTMVDQYSKTHRSNQEMVGRNSGVFSGYPLYPASEDISSKGKIESDLNLDDLAKRKVPNEVPGSMNEKDFEEDMSGDDLDIPGSELDDRQERVGSEDEENNYYSLGGDNHNDLEEDHG